MTVAQFLAGTLDEPSRRRLKSHLAGCTPCCQLVGALVMSTARESVSRARPGAVPEGAARLSRYRIDEPLGVGGMGIVYSAYDPDLDRRVALKVLWQSSVIPGSDADRLRREARAMAKLAHPNVVAVFDVGAEDGRVFLAMELAEGGTMREWMRKGPHPWREVLVRFRQAGAGLAAAHRAGLIHRDFKPENLLLRGDATVLVTDFGLAHEVPYGEALSTLSSQDEGARGPEGAGTPAYMAPEQLRGEPLDARADVYAFSVAVWEALYGTRPFSPDADEGLLGAIAKGAPAPRSPSDRERVPERLRGALARGMSFRRSERHASIDALLAECTLDEGPAPSMRPWARRGALLGVGAAAVLVTGVLLGRRLGPRPLATQGEAPTSAWTLSGTIAPPGASAELAPSPASDTAAPSASAVAAPALSTSSQTHASTGGTRRPPASAVTSKPADVRSPRRGRLSGLDFTPYGFAASEAAAVVHAHVSDFDGCWSEGCLDITCRFGVDVEGRVARATCATWEGRPACPAAQACLTQQIRALRFPAPPEVGECALFFSGR